jgi:hypothetical protein
VVAILQLLVSLAINYHAPIRFPNNVTAQMIVYQRQGKQIVKVRKFLAKDFPVFPKF